MTGDERGFIASICATPDDDLSRLIFADWLDDHGQSERAEFIRAQVWLAANPSCGGCTGREWQHGRPCDECDQREELRRREQTLLGLYWPEWSGEIMARWHCDNLWTPKPSPVPHHGYTRGHVSAITLPLATFTETARELFSRHPITCVVITDATIFPSGGNDTYYLGGLGRFPKEYWRRLDGLSSRRAVLDAVSAVCIGWGRSLAGLGTPSGSPTE